MSHFAGYFQSQAAATAGDNPALQPMRNRLLDGLRRTPSLQVQQVSKPRFWCAAVAVEAWSSSVLVEDAEGNVGAVAGHPLFAEDGDDSTPAHQHSTEQVLRALSSGAIGGLQSCRGMFCAASWHAKGMRLTLATDRLASRPLYFTAPAGNGLVLFATSIRLLRLLAGGPERLDEQGFAEHLFFGQALGDRTVFDGIRVLTPGEVVVFEPGRATQHSHHADYTTTPRLDTDPAAAEQLLHQRFARAVRRRLTSGRQEAFLSGGMDSRAVVAELVDQGQAVNTFCTAYPGSIDDVVGRQIAQAFGVQHTTWHRSPADRVRVALDPFALYAKDHFPPVHQRPARCLWSGDGGSVTLGHVYLTEASVARAGQRPDAGLVRALFPNLATRPTRQISAAETRRLSELATAGALAELERCAAAAPDRRLFHFYMRNDQARHLYHHFESIDLSQIELLTPFFDVDVVALVSALPIDWFLNHRLYNRWITGFRCGAGDFYWQPYRNHVPCPHPSPTTANDQWDNSWYTGADVCRTYAQMAGELARQHEPLAAPYMRKGLMRAGVLLNRLGVSKYNYEIAYARNLIHTVGTPR